MLVSSIFKENKVVENCSRESLLPIIQGLTLVGSTIYTDGWKAYDGLVHNGHEHHRVFHSENARKPASFEKQNSVATAGCDTKAT